MNKERFVSGEKKKNLISRALIGRKGRARQSCKIIPMVLVLYIIYT